MKSNHLVIKDNKIKTNQFKRFLFFILFTMSLTQQLPIIKDMFYSEIRIGLYFIFVIFGSLTMPSINLFLKSEFNLYFFEAVLWSFFIFFLSYLFGEDTFSFLEMLIPFVIFMCSFNTRYNNKQLQTILFWYVMLSVLLGLTSIFYYGEGISITEQYFLEGKNQIGPMLGYASFLVGFWMINITENNKKRKLLNYLLYIGIFILLVISILVIRNRASIVALFLTLSILLLKKIKFKFTMFQYCIAIFLILNIIFLFLMGTFNGIQDFIIGSLFTNYNVDDLNSISAGRTDVYINALFFVKKYPFLGELGIGKYLSGIPHNYIINKWVTLGIFVSLPLVIFYLYLWKSVGKILLKNKKETSTTLPIWLLFFSLIISIFEYTFPYGPGVSQMIVWFLLGQYYRGIQITEIRRLK